MQSNIVCFPLSVCWVTQCGIRDITEVLLYARYL